MTRYGICFVAVLLACGGLAGARVEPDRVPGPAAASSATFAVTYRTGSAWDAKQPPAAQPLFAEHSAHLRELRQQGRLVLGGRYGEVGLTVIKAADLAEAQRLAESDPAVRGKLFAVEVHPWMTFVPGCV